MYKMANVNIFEVVQRLFVEHKKPIPLTDIYDRARTYYRSTETKPTLEEFEELVDKECALGELYEIRMSSKDHDRQFIDYEHLRVADIERILPAVKKCPESNVEKMIHQFLEFQIMENKMNVGATVHEFLDYQRKGNKRFINFPAGRFEKEILQVGVRKKILTLARKTHDRFGVYKAYDSSSQLEIKQVPIDLPQMEESDEEIMLINGVICPSSEDLIITEAKKNTDKQPKLKINETLSSLELSNGASIKTSHNQDETKAISSGGAVQPTRISTRKKIKKDLGSDFVAWNVDNSAYDQSVLSFKTKQSQPRANQFSPSNVGVLTCLNCSLSIQKFNKKKCEALDGNQLINDKIVCFDCGKKAIHTRCLLFPKSTPAYGLVKQFFCNQCRVCCICLSGERLFAIECNDCHRYFHPNCTPPNMPEFKRGDPLKAWVCQMCAKNKRVPVIKVTTSGQSILQQITPRPIGNQSLLQNILKNKVVILKAGGDNANIVVPSGSNGTSLMTSSSLSLVPSVIVRQSSSSSVSSLKFTAPNAASQSLLASKQRKSKLKAIPSHRPYYTDFHKFVQDRQLLSFLPLGNYYTRKEGFRALGLLPPNVQKWNAEHVACYLRVWGFKDFVHHLIDRQISGKQLLDLECSDLVTWGISMGIGTRIVVSWAPLKFIIETGNSVL